MVRKAVAHVASMRAVDPARVGLLGWSRGALLSLHTAPSIPELAAVVSIYGAICGGWLPPNCGDDSEAERRDRELPLTRPPPTLLLHGEADPVFDVAQARRVHELLSSAGRVAELHTYPGADHGFDLPKTDPEYFDEAAATDSRRHLLAFLDERLGG